MENTSGQGKSTVVPEEVKGLAWGAFFWSWIWGLFNRTWIALLVLVPIAGLVVWIMLLFKGREWAWRNKRWDSVEHFNKVQRNWAKAGLIVLFVPFLLGIIAAIVIPMMGNDAGQKVAETSPPAITVKKPVSSVVVSAPAQNVDPITSKSASANAELGSTSTAPVASGSASVADELEAVYAKFHRAGLTANFDEMLKYGTAQPDLATMPAAERQAMLGMLGFLAQILPKTYTVTRKTIDSDGNHATLHLDASGVAGTVIMVKENGVWKVGNADWGGSSRTGELSPDTKAAIAARPEVKHRQPVRETKGQPVRAASKEQTVAAVSERSYQAPPAKVITPKFNDVMTAVLRQDQAGVTELLDLGWWVDKPASSGFTPLMEAVAMGDAPMAELLLKRGANPNAAARDGSMLQIAKRNRDTAMIELLRRYGATVE